MVRKRLNFNELYTLNKPEPIYLDNHLFVVRKPGGMLIQGDRTGDPTVLDWARGYVKEKYNKPGNVFLGLVHRLDRPTSGVVVFARTSKAAARLSEQFRLRRVRKIYWALVEGRISGKGRLKNQIVREGVSSVVRAGPHGKDAELNYRLVRSRKNISWIEVEMSTGRHHQIRVQFSHLGHPVIGDFRYGSRRRFSRNTLALHAYSLTISHPVTKDDVTFRADPEPRWEAYYADL